MAAEARRPSKGILRTVRARTTAGAVLVVGSVLVVASGALLITMHVVMQNSVTDEARLRARDVVAGLEQGRSAADLVVGNDDDVIIQIVTRSNVVVAASRSLAGDPPIVRLPLTGDDIVEHPPIPDDDPFVVTTAIARVSGRPLTVVVGRNLDLVREATAHVSRGLLIGVPLLLLVVGGTTWFVAGRALAPVESIRKEVAAISDSHLDRRVPTPAGDDEIARLASTMNLMLARLQKARDRQRRLVSDAAHELRNPIASIRHHAEVGRAHPDRTTVQGLAADILADDLRLQALTEDLLLLARADEGALHRSDESVDLDDLVLEEANRLKQTTDLEVDIAGVAAARTHGDAAQLQHVIRNLADNAARHARSKVLFSVREADGQIRVLVDDDGPGIPMGDRETVFERFARLDYARDRDDGGAGLGLAIVKEIVGVHGGEATVSDAPLGGARFQVVLPASA